MIQDVYLNFVNKVNYLPIQGIYLYSWFGNTRRKVMPREDMSAHHSMNMEAGKLSNSPHDENIIFQKVQYGEHAVIIFMHISLWSDDDVRLTE